jgi:poly-gamma-glutamate synthesis protein (capsule biosynthesis protein)
MSLSTTGEIVIGAVGDVMVNRDEPASAWRNVRPLLADADVLFANLEASYSDTQERNASSHVWITPSPASFSGIADAGFDVLSLANNHIMDRSYAGLRDTIARVREAGILVVGAGENLAEARAPAIVERNGVRVGFLAYTAVHPPGFEAYSNRAGVRSIRVGVFYKTLMGAPAFPPQPMSAVDPEQKADLLRDVRELRDRVEILICSVHWGVGVIPMQLPHYEIAFGRDLVDAGADVVLGHHQHILKAIELYDGKPIFHGINNFMMDGKPGEYAEGGVAKEAMGNLISVFGDHLTPTHDSASEEKKTIFVRLRATSDGIVEASYVPCLLDPDDDSPAPIAPGTPEWDEHLAYARAITAGVGMTTRFEPRGDEVVVG